MSLARAFVACSLLSAAVVGGCAEKAPEPKPQYLSRDELLKPEACQSCHSAHYREWAGSMHAYASFDPVFLAMNRRGQEETDGKLGSFCVGCHAPLALREGATNDGLNLDQVPRQLQGVTCYFCHDVEGVEGSHNNPLRLSSGVVMRGGLREPRPNSAHAGEYSELFASPRIESATLCGSCHDVLVPSPPAPAALHLERTFSEWQGSIFAPPQAADDTAALSCNGCHMLPTSGVPIADSAGAPLRSRHAHTFAAVDVARRAFPQTGDAELDQASAELQGQDLQRLLDATLRLEICVTTRLTGEASIQVALDNATAGHNFPSGAAQDRRAFVEVQAFAAGADTAYYTSGVLAEGGAIADLDDPDLWLLRDQLFDGAGEPVHQFWQAAELRPGTLPVASDLNPLSPGFVAGHAQRQFPAQGQLEQAPERVTARVRLEPIGHEVMQELVDSGHLDEADARAMPTHSLLPNRHLATTPGAASELSTLSAVSFEWGPATRDHGNFRRTTQTTALGSQECIGMPGRPK